MTFKRLMTFICFTFVVFFSYANVQAIEIKLGDGEIQYTLEKVKENIEVQEIFKFYAEILPEVPDTYNFIDLKYKNITKGTVLEKSLKKLVYLDKIKNVEAKFSYTSTLQAQYFYKLSELILGIDTSGIDKDVYMGRNTNSSDLSRVSYIYNEKVKKEEAEKTAIFNQNEILEDVYRTIKTDYYGKDEVSDEKLLHSAIQGLAKGTEDKYTVYFPPTENKNFQEVLDGDFEGIGAYVELRAPGEFFILSPITDAPAFKAGIKGGDRVIKVGDNKVTESNSSEEIISWIKGPAGTEVEITVEREGEEIEFTITRESVHIANIESQFLQNDTYYVNIKNFGNKVSEEFVEELENIKKDYRVKKIIFDLRNNGGGYLDEVTQMLSHIVDKDKKTAVVKYLHTVSSAKSAGYNTIDLNNYEIVVLINSGTASASEIMVGTMRDYFDITVVGEKSFGKGSVQSIKEYIDGSSLKYTVAKWYTGKTETGIDGVGILPDIEIEFDNELFQKDEIDNQLQKALDL